MTATTWAMPAPSCLGRSGPGLDVRPRCGRRRGRRPCRSGGGAPRRSGRAGPAARASSANPRSSSTGRPRSASAAPQTPAPLSGSRRPSTCSCTRPIASNSRRCGPRSPSSSAMPMSTGVRGSSTLCTGWPRPGTYLPASRVRRTASSATASQPASSVGSLARASLEHRVQVGAAVLGDAEEPRAAAEQAGGQGALQRVGGGEVGQPGGDRGRGEAVVGQRDQHRLEDADLRRRRAGASPPARRPARRSRPCPSGRR